MNGRRPRQGQGSKGDRVSPTIVSGPTPPLHVECPLRSPGVLRDYVTRKIIQPETREEGTLLKALIDRGKGTRGEGEDEVLGLRTSCRRGLLRLKCVIITSTCLLYGQPDSSNPLFPTADGFGVYGPRTGRDVRDGGS